MKVALMNNLYHPFNKGGAESIVRMCHKELERRGVEVIIITTKPYFRKAKNKESNNVYYVNSCYHHLHKLPIFFKLWWHLLDTLSFKKYFYIKRILRRKKVDVAITHNLKGLGLLAPLAIKKNNITHIHTLHDIQLLHPSGLMIYGKEKIIDTSISRIYQRINARLFRFCHTVISPSYWLLNLHKNKGLFGEAKKTRILNPCPQTLKQNPSKVSSGTKAFKFIYAGQIETHKGIFFLLDAFKKYIRSHPSSDAKLIIIGGGSKLSKLQKKETSPQIIFKGKMTRENTLKLINESDCLIVPSLCYENSPTVIYEAASLGLPVIASRIGGIPELVNLFGGVLFEPDNTDDLTAAIKKMETTINKHPKKLEGLKIKQYVDQLLENRKS